ncbi:deaminase domain-containing protein [Bacillus bingmayongensis]|uniref:deaminase domain-containing protein n=1 Tax=Bacillus bingmayongensis TaxID=1150157 RepID=UPI0028BEB49A|nr:deaminase domain-containing protein [Bacillus bingmayongensis]
MSTKVDVSGISKFKFYAQSRINKLTGSLEDKVPIFLCNLEKLMFKATTKAVGKEGGSCLGNTEYKIINHIASKLRENT